MPIRRIPAGLPPEAKQVWAELGKILTELRDRIISGERAGVNMEQAREAYCLFCNNFSKKGAEFWPEEMAKFCSECDLDLPMHVEGH